MVPHGDAYLEILRNQDGKYALGCKIVSEMKCCKRCGAYLTCDHKGECCVECEYYDPVDNICLAGPEKKTKKVEKVEEEEDIDPATFLWDDDEEDEDLDDLPPERDADDEDDDFSFDDDISNDDDW